MTDSTRTVSPTKWKAPWERQLLGGFSFLVKPMESSHNPIFSICDSPQKSSAVLKVYRAGLAAEGRPVFVQPLSLTPFDSSPSRGASGETVHFAGTAKASPTRSNGDDRRQWRKQGGAVGAAASRMRAAAKQTLGAATRAVASRSDDGEGKPVSREPPCSDKLSLCQSEAIAASTRLSASVLALSGAPRQLSQRESLWQAGQL